MVAELLEAHTDSGGRDQRRGIVAFYPSKDPLRHQARFLNGGDLYGDLVRAARADGLTVFARMDCRSAFEPFYKAHPDWFAMTAEGKPYVVGARGGDPAVGMAPGEDDDVVLYTTCINGPYYDEYIPKILRDSERVKQLFTWRTSAV